MDTVLEKKHTSTSGASLGVIHTPLSSLNHDVPNTTNTRASNVEKSGGYMVNLVTSIPQMLLCMFCKLLMRNAIQTFRGERSCQSCYFNAKGDTEICPIDGEPIADEEIFADKHARREISRLPCYCDYMDKGCNWKGIVDDIERHRLECSHGSVLCTTCWSNVVRKDLNQHNKADCTSRQLPCDYCMEMFVAHTLKEHESTCTKKPTDCPYLCGANVVWDNLYDHLQNCGTVNKGMICPYQLIGCKWKYMPNSEENLEKHLQVEAAVHVTLTISNIVHVTALNQKMADDLSNEQDIRKELSKRIEEDANEKRMMSSRITAAEGKICESQNGYMEIEGKLTSGVQKAQRDLTQITNLTEANNLGVINEELEKMSTKITDVENKTIRTSVANNDLNSEEVKNSVVKIGNIENCSAVMSANIADLELKLQLLENTSYNGCQIWKIDNVQYRINQATNGKVTALHSAPCFQRRGGYKFCSRLYLNGDGMGKRTHVSLFFVLMKSEYDLLLQWPFTERVTFRLINPYNKEETIRESFIPDKTSSSFKKPTHDMNIAAGCPMFMRKEDLNKFVIDDVLFIETMISEK